MEIQTLRIRLSALSVLRGTLRLPLLQAYQAVLNAYSQDVFAFASAYGALCDKIYQAKDPSLAIWESIRCDENAVTAALPAPRTEICHAADCDLSTLAALCTLSGADFLQAARQTFPEASAILQQLPPFPSGKVFPFTSGTELTAYYMQNGYGIFAKASHFTIGENGSLFPILHPDPIKLSDLKGYARQKEQVISNTLAFLANQPANNILLYGDKGTGKSSTVKAVVHEFANRGLKIVELAPKQIQHFPELCRQAAHSPFHIIVFMDDLSFDREDDHFAALKAFIEGGLTGKPNNVILYATSNRRHLVRENFSDRQGDEIHVRDTLETVTSLSDRFGLEITFSVPDKDAYLAIIDALAEEYGLALPTAQLHLLAERFALRRNGRSPRTARQFIQQYLTEQNFSS